MWASACASSCTRQAPWSDRPARPAASSIGAIPPDLERVSRSLLRARKRRAQRRSAETRIALRVRLGMRVMFRRNLRMILIHRQPNGGARNRVRRSVAPGRGDGHIEDLWARPRRFGNELYEEARRVFSLRKRLSHFTLMDVVDAGFGRCSLGPP